MSLTVTELTDTEVRDIPIIVIYSVQVTAEVSSHNFPERFFVDAWPWLSNNIKLSININLITFPKLPIYLVTFVNWQERAYGYKKSLL